MLKRQNRLNKEKDFERAIKQGKGKASGFLFLKAIRNKLPCFRAGFVVSKNVSNKAVVRNKIKRRLRQAVCELQAQIKPGWDIVFFARSGIENQGFREIKKEVQYLLRRLIK